MERTTADFSGKWTMKSSENFDELLKTLGERRLSDLSRFIEKYEKKKVQI